MKKSSLAVATLIAAAALPCAVLAATENKPKSDFTQGKTLYVVGYSHLDTQWRWDYPETIEHYLSPTLTDNFKRFEKYPNYIFNFTGSFRYEMTKEYYPEQWEELRKWVKAGRWNVAGAMVEENDVNIPSPESVVRNALYGNRYSKREFGVESDDYLLPDCFGFPASLPSILAHCGLKGFSTQKLVWGSAVGIPFNVGVWEGPDGRSVTAALNGTSYTGRVENNLASNPAWLKRLEGDEKKTGLAVDYRYYGVGDRGGACRESDIANLEKAIAAKGPIRVVSATTQQFYDDLSDEQRAKLPVYRGEILLTEHSAGSLTSQTEMKRMNRKNEQMADSAERARVVADKLGTLAYPGADFERHWVRVLGSQMHDTMPGTCLPECYDFSYNDEMLSLKGFGDLLTDGVSAIAANLKTDAAPGTPVVVWNPLAFEREDVVEISVQDAPANPVAFDGNGRALLTQTLSRDGTTARLLVLVSAPSLGVTTIHIREGIPPMTGEVSITAGGHNAKLANARYQVTLSAAGDIASVKDHRLGRELLSAPAQLQFLHENPEKYPAWNMDWKDRKNAPEGVVAGPPKIRVVENGPVRVALEIEREARGSKFIQTVSLAARSDLVDIAAHIDWRAQACSLKQSFPLTASSPEATYNMGLGTIRRGSNDPKKFEVPSREWFDLTDKSGAFGVTVLEDSRFGSDKPDDNTLRLTLLYTPAVRKDFLEQKWQDWGKHDTAYALYPHAGDAVAGRADRAGRRFNQPLRAFVATRHDGPLASAVSFFRVNSDQVDVRAMKKAEDGDAVIVRLQELAGKPTGPLEISFGDGVAEAWEVDGQERRIAPATVADGVLKAGTFGKFACRAFAIVPKPFAAKAVAPATNRPLDLAFDADVVSTNANRADGDFTGGATLPAEQLPAQIVSGGVTFKTGATTDGAKNALVARGQKLSVPAGTTGVRLLVAADEDTTATIAGIDFSVPAWNKPVANWDARVWEGKSGRNFRKQIEPGDGWEFKYDLPMKGIAPGFVKPGRVAWYASHHHTPKGDAAYRFSYLFELRVPVASGATEVVLPDNAKVKVFAATAVQDAPAPLTPAAPIHDAWGK
jgi:alpha-mannosidase